MRSSTVTSRNGRSRRAASAAATIAARLAPRSARRRTRRVSTGTRSAPERRLGAGDQPGVGEARGAVAHDRLVAGIADHLEEGRARRVAHDGDGVPLARRGADERLVAGPGPQDGAADAREVLARRGRVTRVGLGAVTLLEAQQVEHEDRLGTLGGRAEGLRLFAGGIDVHAAGCYRALTRCHM